MTFNIHRFTLIKRLNDLAEKKRHLIPVKLMKLKFATRARRFYFRPPLIANIWAQINFWIIAFFVFFSLLYFIYKLIS